MYWRSKALLYTGKMDEACAELTSALELSEQMGTPHTTWRIHAALAELSPADKSFHREKAREIIQYIADHAPAELRVSYLELPEIQKIINTP
jgi:BioD-like phosphotransacetylase family protein